MPLMAFAVFFLFFAAGPWLQMSGLRNMPGDVGDARLNNYFLENIYQFLSGNSESLWHLGFFSPFPFVGGFSDNLLGASPLYLFFRSVDIQADTSFQLWYLGSYLANFCAAFYALGRLKLSSFGACIGAVIFTFALPVTAHSGHAQLSYRFGVPLAVAMFILFLQNRRWVYLLAAAGWTVWQFYCSIYIGFFLSLLLMAVGGTFLVFCLGIRVDHWRGFLSDISGDCRAASFPSRVAALVSVALLAGALVLLFYPYWQVTQLYDFERSPEEIATMLPTPQSYFLSDISMLWKSNSALFADLLMRHEHQMFAGALALALAAMGFVVGIKSAASHFVLLLGGGLIVLVILTLSVYGVTVWSIFWGLPLFSSIRAVTRMDLVLLFPLGYLAGVSADYLENFRGRFSAVALPFLVVALLVEFSFVTAPTSTKSEWRERIHRKSATLPEELPPQAILFWAQEDGPPFAEELDAMWIALQRGRPTMNGYTGNYPPGYSYKFGKDPGEIANRANAYAFFRYPENPLAGLSELKGRIMALGFDLPSEN